MQKVFIADHNEDFAMILAGSLRARFLVETCPEGSRALERLRSERPDVLILDLMLPGISALDLLKTARTEQLCSAVIITSRFFSDYLLEVLQRYRVDYAARKPCTIQSITDRVEELLTGAEPLQPAVPDSHSAVTSMLLALNVPTHRKGFRYCRAGILLLARDPGQQVTKEVYPAIAKEFSTSSTAVEKAIRSAIDTAWENRSDSIWRQYFPPAPSGQIPRPTNTQFLTRLSDALGSGQNRMAR